MTLAQVSRLRVSATQRIVAAIVGLFMILFGAAVTSIAIRVLFQGWLPMRLVAVPIIALGVRWYLPGGIHLLAMSLVPLSKLSMEGSTLTIRSSSSIQYRLEVQPAAIQGFSDVTADAPGSARWIFMPLRLFAVALWRTKVFESVLLSGRFDDPILDLTLPPAKPNLSIRVRSQSVVLAEDTSNDPGRKHRKRTYMIGATRILMAFDDDELEKAIRMIRDAGVPRGAGHPVRLERSQSAWLQSVLALGLGVMWIILLRTQ